VWHLSNLNFSNQEARQGGSMQRGSKAPSIAKRSSLAGAGAQVNTHTHTHAVNERRFGGHDAHPIGILVKRLRAQIGKELD
jgi:hypothetical protein